MAELALGLTKSVVDVVLTKAQAALEQEGKLRKSAQRQLVFITDEFQMMQSFLGVADDERVGNPVVVTWVRQIRELAYDMEDGIEFVVHLKKSGKWRRLLHALTPPCIPTAALPLDVAVEEIEQLTQRVEDVSKRNARYSLISDTGSKPVAQAAAAASSSAADAAGAINLQLLQDMDAGAGKRQQGDLTQFITNQDHDGHGQDLEVISVWGTGGDRGTTSLIRKAYTDPEICTTFPCRAWVKLLVRPLDPCEFVRCLVAQFHANSRSCRKDDENTAAAVPMGLRFLQQTKDDGAAEFERQITKNRYLVVLEGVSDMQEWDAIRSFLPDVKNGSRIIVSTQQFEIARLCIGQSAQVLQLEQFSADHSVCAFFREGSQSVGGKSGDTDRAPSSNTGHDSSSSQEFCIGVDTILKEKREAANSWMNSHPHFCRQSEMNELRKIVASTRFNEHKVSMSVWGIAGVGKTHLIKNLFYFYVLRRSSNDSGQGQFDKYSWVNISQPFSLRDFCWSLLLGFESESSQGKENAYKHMIGSKNPIQECRRLLKDRRCLVVIDDLQSKEQWDSIRENLVSECRSLIIVITTEASVAAHCACNEDLVFNVKGLEAEAAFGLFNSKSKVPIPSQQDETKSMIEQLVLKCGGLPKVIDAIATLLAPKTVGRMDTARTINQRFIHQLETNLEFKSLRGLFVWMHNYFRTCPDHLKPCIFYMSIFPQAHRIRRRRLVRRWIAEGYSRDSDDKSAEDNGEEFFSKLIDLSIVQEPPEFHIKKLCQVNGFIREYIVSRRMEENLIFELGDTCALTTQRTGRHLVIRETWDRDKIVFGSMDFSRLRSLTVFGKWKTFFISESMKMLRALDLEDASDVTDDDVEQMVKQLRRLKFLSLRGCSGVHRLPCSVRELRQLQSLDVRHTSIVTLPVGITKLQKLQYIRAGTTIPGMEEEPGSCPSGCLLSSSSRRHYLHGVKAPRGIGKLTAQHTLGVVNIGASSGKAILKELKELTQLRKLGVSGINKKNCKEFFCAISDHKHLESLFVHLDKGTGGCLGDISKPTAVKNLLSLKLYGSLDTLPRGIGGLSKLAKLDLMVTKLEKDDIQELGELPNLTILRIHLKPVNEGNNDHLKPVNEGNNDLDFRVKINNIESDNHYKKVRILEIACSSSLTVTFGSKAMMNLEVLKRYCMTESVKSSGLEKLKNFKVDYWYRCVDWTAPAAQATPYAHRKIRRQQENEKLHSRSS